ncbi:MULTISPECIES: ATP-binding protein [Pontibacillus]|uniref:AAA family ATPase n=1 Tax=Pontibacillus chungwhensis TaxID=265426 RepID=A0ABY8UYZ9_9BACI|nr:MULTISPECIES: AAA family ATPase [Pontibacillus]MCD5324953.1 AAA family ATPase [Pontibacillus sp. HN14]WIF98912.1 AAA family ATPase [Pontibacillus chungwhensis]
MRLKQAFIYGFGKWQQETIDFREDGLTVFYGKNEAGKSTLRQFMMYMLFNFPPKKVKAFVPKMGGTVGGRLVIEDPSYGLITVEREMNQNGGKARCLFDDGTEREEDWLRHYLKGIDQPTFEAIFSFDLHDIQHIHTIGSKAIGDVLFGVGMTGSEQIYKVESKLEKEMERLFKKQGKKPELNEQFALVKEMEGTQAQLKQEERKYADLKMEEDEASNELNQLQEKRSAGTLHKDRLEKHNQAAHLIFRYQQLTEKRTSLPDHLSFPEQGLERYYKWKEQEMPILSEREVVQQSLKEIEAEREGVPDYDADLVDEGTKWMERKPEYDRNDARLETLIAESTQEQDQISRKLDELGIQLTFEELLDLSLPFYLEEEWQQMSREKASLEEDKDRLHQEIRANQEEQSRIQRYVSEHRDKRLSEEEEARLRAKVSNARENVWKKEMEEEELKSRNQFAKKQSKLGNQMAVVGIVLAFAGGISGWILSDPIWFIFSAILLIATLLLVNQLKQSTVQSPTNDRRGEEVSTATLSEWERQLQEQDHLVQERLKYEQEGQTLRMREIQLEEQLHTLGQRQQRIKQVIEEQVENYPFLRDVSETYWPKVYQRLSNLQTRQHEWWKKQEQIESIAARQKTLENQLFFFADRLQLGREGEIGFIWNNVADYVEKAEESKRDRSKLTERSIHLQKQLEQLEQRQGPIQRELQQLYDKACVTEAESFLQKGEMATEIANIEAELHQVEKQIDTIYMDNDASSEAKSMKIDEPSLKEALERARGELEAVEKEIEEKRQQLADLRSAIQYLEKDDRYSKKRHEVTLGKEKSRELAKEWATYKVAHTFLKRTKQMYQEERMPAVIEYCGHFFSILTRGTYLRVWMPEEGALTVERKDGYRFSVESLSQGTKEQLYVALRLALSQTIKEEHPLPFIIDDAFVNFDNERTDEMLEVLQQISQDQQVILFTCNDAINQKITERKKIFL